MSSTHRSSLGSRRALWKSCFLPKNPNTMTQSRLQPRPHDLESDSFGNWSCSQTVYLWLYPKDQDITGWLKNKPVVGDKSGKCNLCQLCDTPSQTIVKLLLLQLFFLLNLLTFYYKLSNLDFFIQSNSESLPLSERELTSLHGYLPNYFPLEINAPKIKKEKMWYKWEARVGSDPVLCTNSISVDQSIWYMSVMS